MNSYRGDGDRTSVAVIGGVVDALEVEGDADSFLQFPVVVRLNDLLRVVTQSAVAEDEAETARRQVIAVTVRDPIDYPRKTDLVLRSVPAFSLEQQAHRQGRVDLRECP